MVKKLLALLSFGLCFGLGMNAYSQSSKEEIPEAVKKEAAVYLSRVPYCPGEPIIEKIGEKIEDRLIILSERTGAEKAKDGIKDKITLYRIRNDCPWFNVPNYVVYTQFGLKGGGYTEKGVVSEIISKDKEEKDVDLKEW